MLGGWVIGALLAALLAALVLQRARRRAQVDADKRRVRAAVAQARSPNEKLEKRSYTVLFLNGSPRRNGNTAMVLEAIKEFVESFNAQAGCSLLHVEVLHLADLHLQSCLGCARCITTGVCPLALVPQDKFHADFLPKLKGCDAIVLASPVYSLHVSGLMKVLIDRLAVFIHRPVLPGVPSLAVVTTAAAFSGRVAKFLSEVALHIGCHPCGEITRIGTSPEDTNKVITLTEQEKNTVYAMLASMVTPRPEFEPSMWEVGKFHVQRLAAKFTPKVRSCLPRRGNKRAAWPVSGANFRRAGRRILGAVPGQEFLL
eukprot:TRINITY_DN2214_c0_g1_i3.p1 TRINITY_DN2214_c0_g1~~TRINITY_DN2214_c0_g1_i3.p1  ORF type:complete len:314 (-),score=44.92 TRINITY_DN2214_c0_g1_i3:153-1094(-)